MARAEPRRADVDRARESLAREDFARDSLAREDFARVVVRESLVPERERPPRALEPLLAVEDTLRREAPRCVVVLRAMPGVL